MTIDKLAWLHIQDRKALFVRSKKHDFFISPGGKREEDETDEEALVREVREELSVELVPDSIAYAKQFEARAPDGRPLVSTCYFAIHRGDLVPAAEIDTLAWFTSADAGRTTEMGGKILHWLKEQDLID